MKKVFNQREYEKQWHKENYSQFKASLPKKEKEEIDNFLKKENLSKAEFIRKAYEIMQQKKK